MKRLFNRNDRRSVKELFQVALSEFENNKAWNAIGVLRLRGTREVFETARKLCASPVAKEREVGVNVLAQIGCRVGGKPKFMKQSVSLLIDRLQDRSIGVISAAAVGLGHRHDPRSIPYLIALKNHPNARVRYGVAFGLAGQTTSQAVKAKIELTRDRDRDVRDYATFGLAELTRLASFRLLNTKPIRDALFARLKERDVEIRGQALIGLAERKDPRVLRPLKGELATEFHGLWAIEAAEQARHPSLYPLLIKLQKKWEFPADHYFTTALKDALSACKPRKP